MGRDTDPATRGRLRPWLVLFAVCRLGAGAVAVGLLALQPATDRDLLLGAAAVGWSAATLLVAAAWPRMGGRPPAWGVDVGVTLALVLAGGEWRSPFYLLAVSALVLPAALLPFRRALLAAGAFTVAYFAVALLSGVDWDALGSTARLESFSTHLIIPVLVVLALAYPAHLLAALDDARERALALAVEAERRRIAWELHDSAKQRVHAAQLVVSSVLANNGAGGHSPLRMALDELARAAEEMDGSLSELGTALEGRPLHEAIAVRAAELEAAGGVPIAVTGRVQRVSPHVAAHVFRVASEAMTNALRHARPRHVSVELAAEPGGLRLRVADDGRGLPDELPAGSTGLSSMQARARSLGGRLEVGPPPGGADGTVVELSVPLEHDPAAGEGRRELR
jgi:signal transduction histidine kinase